jgi:hypothetical protein
MVRDNHLFPAKGVAPFLVTSGLTGQNKLMRPQNSDYLIRREARQSALTQS